MLPSQNLEVSNENKCSNEKEKVEQQSSKQVRRVAENNQEKRVEAAGKTSDQEVVQTGKIEKKKRASGPVKRAPTFQD